MNLFIFNFLKSLKAYQKEQILTIIAIIIHGCKCKDAQSSFNMLHHLIFTRTQQTDMIQFKFTCYNLDVNPGSLQLNSLQSHHKYSREITRVGKELKQQKFSYTAGRIVSCHRYYNQFGKHLFASIYCVTPQSHYQLNPLKKTMNMYMRRQTYL